MFDVKTELAKIPDNPGIYLMKNDLDEIIYIGKAKNLKKRIKQYFQSLNHSHKIRKMIQNIASFEYIITDSEIEALMLEANFIKKHKPKYNTMMTDDKTYPYIKVTINEKFPRVIKVRQIKKDGGRYFGPYTSAYAVKQTIDAMRDIFKIRSCNLKIITGREYKRPCLNYYINRCAGPCIGKISSEAYGEIIAQAIDLLNGKEEKLISELEKRMMIASDQLQYEHAAEYRDKINAIRLLSEKQKITTTSLKDSDVIGTAVGDRDAVVQIFFIRGGKIVGKEDYHLRINLDDSREEVIEIFLKQYYSGEVYIPNEIFVELITEEIHLINQWLSFTKGSKVEVKAPQKGEKSMLIKMVRKNAEEKLEKDIQKILDRKSDYLEAVEELSEMFDFKIKIDRIEAYDISNIQGVENVGSMVVFEEGELKRRDYRRYRIKSVYGQNDYKSMQEMIDRRIERGLKEKSLSESEEKFGSLPDVMMIDGGKGHVNTAEAVLRDYGLVIPVCGMVKDDKHMTRGLLYKDKEIKLPRNSKLYRLISTIQNEAHRFAINYHRDLRRKSVFKTILDDIQGIGEKRKLNLLNAFGSVEGISKATRDELNNVPAMNKKSADEVYRFFHQKEGDVHENNTHQ